MSSPDDTLTTKELAEFLSDCLLDEGEDLPTLPAVIQCCDGAWVSNADDTYTFHYDDEDSQAILDSYRWRYTKD